MRRWGWLVAMALAGAAASPAATTAAYADEKNEKDVKLDEIPAPARQTILREAAGSPILKVEEETTNGKKLYEAHVKKGNDILEVKVDANGTLIEKKSEKSEK